MHYRIFARSGKQIEAVKVGWSWPAFIFTFWWALIKKLWWRATGVLCVGGSSNFLVNEGELLIENGNERGLLLGGIGVFLLLGLCLY